MPSYRSPFLQTLAERGFIHQISNADGLDSIASRPPRGKPSLVAYIGFDCTAPSLHVGHLLSLMMLRHLQASGGKPLVVVGGGTSRIGDPSGRDKTRTLLTPAQIARNKRALAKVFKRFLKFGRGKTDAMLIDNKTWLTKLRWVDFMRDYGQHFSVNRMLGFDSVRIRLEREQNLSLLEFNYMVAQAYDFLELHRRYACRLQMGGSDQWGNIVNGIELARRVGRDELFALTSPLLTTMSGDKMGKTADGAVWLDAKMLTPISYWQFWRDCADADVARFLRLFTLLPLDKINALTAEKGDSLNAAKIALANATTAMLHGRGAAKSAQESAAAGVTLESAAATLAELDEGFGYLTAFVRAGLTQSNAEARRLIEGGGARLNDQPITDVRGKITRADLGDDNTVKLSGGKKRHALLSFA